MKRIFWVTLFGFGAAALGGCPIYPDNGSQRYCDNSGCYNCPGGSYSDSCVGWQCGGNSDCPNGYACGDQGYCIPGGDGGIFTSPDGGGCSTSAQCPAGDSCGANNQCAPGDCTNNGCPAPLVCKLTNGSPQCVSLGDSGTQPADGGTDAPVFTGCQNDSECIALGPGAKCLDGTCVAAPDQCWDTTQCPDNESCVNGVCTATCSTDMTCPTGYSCNSTSDGGASGVCSGDPTPCGSAGETCPGGTTCVDQHCVTPCSANGTCPSGEICVDNGCIPDQKPNPFVCNTDGQMGDGQAGDCAVGSVCLHHSCYIACNPEAGADACKTADQFNECKSVTSTSGSYYVCGSSTNLGGQCDPTAGKACPNPNEICVDGYCD